MNCLLWNCRGANKPNFRRSIRYIMKKFDTDVLALFETHAAGNRADCICRRLGFDNSFRVDAQGHSGGVWLLSGIGQVIIVGSGTQYIHARIDTGGDVVNIIVVYAAPTTSRRSGLWAELTTIVRGLSDPVFIGGDFNSIVRLDERSGGNGRLSADSVEFGRWINGLSLIDLGFKGNQFTWKRGRSNYIAKRLDRVLCCPMTRLKWHEAVVSHLPFLSSDHAPLYLQLCPIQRGNPLRRPFRFEAAWLHHPSFKDLLSASWNCELATPAALAILRSKLRKWNRDVFGRIQEKKRTLMSEIQCVQDLIVTGRSDFLLAREETLIKELDEVLEQEEILWFQKSREKWIALGDRNTSFFHMSTIIRRRRNSIEMLRREDGSWETERSQLEGMALQFFKRLYSMEDVPSEVAGLPQSGFVPMSCSDVETLMKPFTAMEVEGAVRSMGSFKAPGPDGFQPVFYQQCWDVVVDSVVRFVLEFFASGKLLRATNDALLVLIAKVNKPERISQFQPISLCNVLFKTITKTMVIRLKQVISKLVGPTQSSFIPGRLSTDNIVIVQEAVHSMRRKQGRKGWMLLKLDLEKAYDRIRWDFLEDTIRATGLPTTWVGWIMECVSGPSMSLLWNGEKTSAFRPTRGLRQGDPLSPYLFVLCLERLCHLIDEAVGKGDWKPIRLSRGGPLLSHICFGDDLILFVEASVAQIGVLRRVLENFCLASGQKVSLEKSKIFFSRNVSREKETLISNASGIASTRDLGKYLGMPILQKCLNKETFREILERVSSRLAGWKGRSLSLAGRLALTKSVLSAIPIHSMSSIMLPASTLASLDKVAHNFIWGSTTESRRQHLVAWNRVCRPKLEGGLGLRRAGVMNRALLGKLGWRVLKDKTSLWARVLREKYKIGDVRDPLWLSPKGRWSSTWRSISVGIREVVLRGISWVPGDGRSIKFWTDRWALKVPLLEVALDTVPVEEVNKLVIDYWKPGLGWVGICRRWRGGCRSSLSFPCRRLL
ncbi:LOW QUALITY PROTEIN: hypothetical protein V2J09_005444 [Rumex salicifolius]